MQQGKPCARAVERSHPESSGPVGGCRGIRRCAACSAAFAACSEMKLTKGSFAPRLSGSTGLQEANRGCHVAVGKLAGHFFFSRGKSDALFPPRVRARRPRNVIKLILQTQSGGPGIDDCANPQTRGAQLVRSQQPRLRPCVWSASHVFRDVSRGDKRPATRHRSPPCNASAPRGRRNRCEPTSRLSPSVASHCGAQILRVSRRSHGCGHFDEGER